MTATPEAPEILLRHHLKKLKLPTVLRESYGRSWVMRDERAAYRGGC